MSNRSALLRIQMAVVLLAGTLGAVALAQPADAATVYSCRASVAALDFDGDPTTERDVEPFVANPDGSPCTTDDSSLVNEELSDPALGTLAIKVASAETTDTGTGSQAEAAVTKVTLSDAAGTILEARVLTSQASATCTGNAATFTSSSEVVGLNVLGEDISVDGGQPDQLDLGPLGVLYVNYNETDADSTTQRALFLDNNAVIGDVIIAESIADIEGGCGGGQEICGNGIDDDGDGLIDEDCPPNPECSDNVDNGDPEDNLADEDDPGCHTDGDPNNPGSYDPNDDDETDGGGAPECSDGVDNGDSEDELADEDDPGCHTDGDPNNPGSYDPNDDDETDVPECSDTGDNDGDGVADEDDPGCHTDGDPDDGDDTYDPDDDDETDEPECSDGGDNDDDGDSDMDDDDCDNPDDNDEAGGFMTGGGRINDEVGRVTHGFTLQCDAEYGDEPNQLEVSWANKTSFNLQTVFANRCSDDPDINPVPPREDFDTLEGSGEGRCNKGPKNAVYTVEYKMTDAGEPGTLDYFEVHIDGPNANDPCDLDAAGFLESGNHQAHEE
ncbi:MAG: hypothetical protein H0U53_08945 [Actinobacteria bacterium]|nr:hypothetical protein [Actinomycetota bacterium]